MRYLNLLSIQLLLATLLNISVPSALYAQLSISTDPFIQKQIAREHWAPGGKHYPSSFRNVGSVIEKTGNVSVSVLSTHKIGNFKLQNANIKGRYGFVIDISSPHGFNVHSPFDSVFTDTKAFQEDSNDGRQSSVQITSKGSFKHPANGYDPPAGGGYPSPRGARDIVKFAIKGIATGTYPLSNSEIQNRDIAPGFTARIKNSLKTGADEYFKNERRENDGFHQAFNAVTGYDPGLHRGAGQRVRDFGNGVADIVLARLNQKVDTSWGFITGVFEPEAISLQTAIDNAHVSGYKQLDVRLQHSYLQARSDVASLLKEYPEIGKVAEFAKYIPGASAVGVGVVGKVMIGTATRSVDKLKYSPRVRSRGAGDPKSHNFPYSYDKEILKTKPNIKNNGYKIYKKEGTMTGKIVIDPKTGVRTQQYKKGVYEIGVRKDGVIDHRFFRPTN